MPQLYEDLVDYATGEHLGRREVLEKGEQIKMPTTKKQKEGWKYVQSEVKPLPFFLQEQFGIFMNLEYIYKIRVSNLFTMI